MTSKARKASKIRSKGDREFAQLLASAIDNQSRRRGMKPDPQDRVAVQKLFNVKLPKKGQNQARRGSSL